MSIKKIALFLLILAVPFIAFSQAQKKTVTQGLLYFSLVKEKNGKKIIIAKDEGRAIKQDSLRMAEGIAATYKAGTKISNVKDMVYDSYFLGLDKDPTILQDMQGLTFDASIWSSCIDSLEKKEQVVFQIREITLDDGTKIKNPKLAKENKATYPVFTNPNFPPGGWKSKADHWISMWKEWFKIKDKDNSFYKMDDKLLELYASGIVYTIR